MSSLELHGGNFMISFVDFIIQIIHLPVFRAHESSVFSEGSNASSDCKTLPSPCDIQISRVSQIAHRLAVTGAMALLQTSALLVPGASPAAAAPRAALHCGNLRTVFVNSRVGRVSLSRQLGTQNGSRVSAWFKFGSNGVDSESAGIYGSQKRDDFDRDDVEQV